MRPQVAPTKGEHGNVSPAAKLKRARILHASVRFAVQALFFMLMPALFSTGFMGAKYVCEQIYKRGAIELNPFVLTMLLLFAFTIVFGRFFCGYACAFGSLGDWLFTVSTFAQKRLRINVGAIINRPRVLHILQYIKYVVLIAILAACLTGTYGVVSSSDPWGLFASLKVANFTLNGYSIYAVVLLALIILAMLLVERAFCQFFCPMGALFALLPMLPVVPFTRDKANCIKGCSACVKACPAAIELSEATTKTGECFQCGKCADRCPKGNLTTAVRKFKGTSVVWVLAKSAILFAICYIWIGI
jgi:polyferredoxin